LVAEDAHLYGFAVLAYFRILGLKSAKSSEDNKDVKRWIDLNENGLPHWLADTVARIRQEAGQRALSAYLLGERRLAVAHATQSSSKFDPDDISELRRMMDAAEVLKWFARRFLVTELSVDE